MPARGLDDAVAPEPRDHAAGRFHGKAQQLRHFPAIGAGDAPLHQTRTRAGAGAQGQPIESVLAVEDVVVQLGKNLSDFVFEQLAVLSAHLLGGPDESPLEKAIPHRSGRGLELGAFARALENVHAGHGATLRLQILDERRGVPLRDDSDDDLTE